MSAYVPRRPEIVVRSPDRKQGGKKPNFSGQEEKNEFLPMAVNPMMNTKKLDLSDHNTEPVPVKKQTFAKHKFTIYTNLQKCRYSSDLVRMAETAGMVFELKDVSKLSSIPHWLHGTPTIHYEGEAYSGDLAFEFIEYLKHFEEESNLSSTPILNVTGKEESAGSSFIGSFSSPSYSGEHDPKYNTSVDQLNKLLESRGIRS